VAARYDRRRFEGPLRRWKERRDGVLVLELLRRAGAVGRVLDLPCGTARLASVLAGAGHRVVGCDLSAAMLDARRPSAGAALGFVRGDCERLPFVRGAFDAVVSLRFLFHVRDRALRIEMLREMARVSRVCVVGQVREPQSLKHRLRSLRSRVGLAARYRPAEGRRALADELRAAGLELVLLAPVSLAFSDKALFLARPAAR
jgi:SAM-dependent methyltransferase